MTMIRKILVPVDFSRESAEALKFAADLSRRYEATLDIVHVFNVPTLALPEGYVVPTQEQFALMVSQREGQLAQVKRDAIDAGAVNVEARLVQGHPVSEILTIAKQEKPDLIVMGTHGRTGMKHLLIGSVAENVVRYAPCPVVTTRGPVAA
jgi:nucleotide-binding universal stress UspA family protein